MKKVLVFGTFDGLHNGHLNFLKQAKRYGDYLVAVVSRDSTVRKNKKKEPKLNEEDRLQAVKECGFVQEVLFGIGNHDPNKDSYEIINQIKPDVICLGYDQAIFKGKLKSELKRMSINAEIKILKAYKPNIYKSSILNNYLC